MMPKHIECNYSELLNNTNFNVVEHSIIQRLSGKDKYVITDLRHNNSPVPFIYNYSKEYGQTIITDFKLFCDFKDVFRVPRFVHYFGFILGCLLLGFASDKGGRKIIILACIWTCGVMSVFQLIGQDFISFVFFQFFLGLFIGVSFWVFFSFAANSSKTTFF